MKYLSLDIESLRKSRTWAQAHEHPWMALACLNLWIAAAERESEGIPDHDPTLARLAGVPVDVFISIKPQVMSAWDIRGGEWFHPVILAEYRRFSSKVTAGKQGAKKRWQNKDVDGTPNGSPKGTHMGSQKEPTWSPNANPGSHSQSHSQTTTPKPPSNSNGSGPEVAPVFERVCRLLKIDFAKLRRNAAWSNLPASIAAWVEAGCDLELDVWPTIERLGLAAIARGDLPKTPGYFNAEILAARDRRRVANSGNGAMVTVENCTDPFEWSDRLQVWRSTKKWNPKWGPKPDQPDTMVPRFILDHPQGHLHPQYRTPAEPAWEWLPDGTHTWPEIGGK